MAGVVIYAVVDIVLQLRPPHYSAISQWARTAGS